MVTFEVSYEKASQNVNAEFEKFNIVKLDEIIAPTIVLAYSKQKERLEEVYINADIPNNIRIS